MKRFKIIDRIVEIKIRLDRGNSLVYWFRNIIIIIAGIKYILELNIPATFILGLITVVIIYILGKIDLDYLGLMQQEQKLLTSKYNPHLALIKGFKQ